MPIESKKLYKYTSANTARLILKNKSFRFSRPTAFNDPFDMRIDELFPGDDITFTNELQNKYVERLVKGKISDSLHPLMPRINQGIVKLTEEDLQSFRREFVQQPSDLDVKILEPLLQFTKQVLMAYGVFCCSLRNDSILMWSHYAEDHKGLVFEITPQKDSRFLQAKPVTYMQNRTVLYDSPESFLDMAQKQSTDLANLILEKFTYRKSIEWQYEQEYRLAIPGIIPIGQDCFDQTFDIRDITGIYFGCRMSEGDKEYIYSIAKEMRNDIKIKIATTSKSHYHLDFTDL